MVASEHTLLERVTDYTKLPGLAGDSLKHPAARP